MIILDKIVLAPLHGVIWIGEKIHSFVQEEREKAPQQIRDQLKELYMLLELGKITEDEFDEQEGPLLDLLDELEEE